MLKIFAYHKINCIDSDSLTVNTAMFLRQLDYIEDKGFNFVSPTKLDIESKRGVLLTFDDGYKDNYRVVYPLLKARGIQAIVFITYDFIGKEEMLNLEELRIISEDNFVIGSHTLSHPRLSTLSREEAKKEIFESKQRLAKLLNREIEYFSYPYGDLNREVVGLVMEAGYKAAFVTSRKYGMRNSAFTLMRYDISRYNYFPVFKLRLALPV